MAKEFADERRGPDVIMIGDAKSLAEHRRVGLGMGHQTAQENGREILIERK